MVQIGNWMVAFIASGLCWLAPVIAWHLLGTIMKEDDNEHTAKTR
jgi:hypothetical protein